MGKAMKAMAPGASLRISAKLACFQPNSIQGMSRLTMTQSSRVQKMLATAKTSAVTRALPPRMTGTIMKAKAMKVKELLTMEPKG